VGNELEAHERKPLAWAVCPEPVLALEGETFDDATISAMESRYGTTRSHMKRTQELAGSVAVRLGLGSDETWAVRYAAVLHDIGKVGIPRSILDKTGRLSEAEWKLVRRHPEIGAKLLSEVAWCERVCAAVAAHHEHFDGQGYPAGLAGPDIPIEARLISVADAYDAMTNDRPYRRALSHERAIEQLDLEAGSQFDPVVVEATKAVLYESGEVTQRRCRRLGLLTGPGSLP
jgi:putative nucleotidyltransferase with HDIG domain